MNRRVLLLVSDGEQTVNTDRQAIITAANTFKSLGGIVIVIGVRASGAGFDLLERVATGGFFLNALAGNVNDVLEQLNYLKSLLCAGFCVPLGDEFVNSPARNYSSFDNWEVTSGQVNLVGEDLLNFLDTAGLYVELNGGSPATIRTIDQFAIVSGRNYRISFDTAGNQRESVAGQGVKVYLRAVGAADSDPNIFEQTVYPDWDGAFHHYSFSFNATATVGARLYVEQLYSGTPTIGNFVDNVKLEELSTGSILLNDTFDAENLTYIPPRCGTSPGLDAIANPTAPVITVAADQGTALAETEVYTYSLSAVTNEGETAATICSTDPFGPLAEFDGTILQVTWPADTTGRVLSWRLWRSLGIGTFDWIGPGEARYLLAELPANVTSYLDTERKAAFTARHEPTVTEPTANTTAAAAGALGSSYGGCCYETQLDYGAGENLTAQMTSNTEPAGYVVTSGTDNTVPEELWHAFDHDMLTRIWFLPPVGVYENTEWLQYQFPVPKIITAYRLTSYMSGVESAPGGWILSGSNNGTTWTQLDSRSGVTGWVDLTEVTQLFYITAPASYAYYRITFNEVFNPGTATFFSVTELELLGGTGTTSTFTDNCPPCAIGTPGVQVAESPPLGNIETTDGPPPSGSFTVEQCAVCPAGFVNLSATLVPKMASSFAPSGLVAASSETTGGTIQYPAWQAFDKTALPWVATADAPQWLRYFFTAAKTVKAYGIRVHNVSASPKNFELQGSNDALSWTTLDSRTAITWAPGQLKRWLVTTPGSYLYYRLYISATNPVLPVSPGYVSLQELELYDLPANPCASATASSLPAATAAALASATAMLNCVPIFTETLSYTARPDGQTGPDITQQATQQSLNSPEEAKSGAQAQAEASAQAQAALVWT